MAEKETDQHRPRLAIVTGAASGIGLSVAKRLHEQGHQLILIDRSATVDETAADLGPSASTLILDITDEDAWAPIRELAQIDVLINCAGILGPTVPTVDLALSEFEQVMRVNLTGTFLGCRAVLPNMIAATSGAIVNVASATGKDGNPLLSAYSASKAAVIGYTKAVAKEVATNGVRVNCVAPTVVEGDFSAAMSDEHRSTLLAKIPLGRFVRADEVAAMIAWVASPDCSFSTGFCFDCTGGRSTY